MVAFFNLDSSFLDLLVTKFDFNQNGWSRPQSTTVLVVISYGMLRKLGENPFNFGPKFYDGCNNLTMCRWCVAIAVVQTIATPT